VAGQAVNDVVHLVAELVENATTFSPEDTQVYVSGQPLTTGGVLLDVTDGGVGISDQEMGHANWRLDNPPVVDVGVSRRMGLFVVGRLAARHGVRVRLRHASSGGLTALVWLPDTVAQQEGAPLGRLRPFGVEDYGPAPSLSAPTAAALPTRQAGAQLPPPGGVPQPGAAAGGAAAQAAAAARIPRFSPPTPNPSPQPRQGSGPQPLPTRPANGAGAARGFSSPGAPGAQPPQPAQSAQSGAGTGGFSAQPGPSGPGTGSFGGFTQPGGFGDSGTGPMPAVPPTPSAPDNGAKGTNGEVRVPAPPENGHEQRLPIFDSLESDWFRRGGSAPTATLPAASETGAQPAQPEWHSPADEGWRAAETVAAPTTGTTTSAGLPRRVPRANLVPGSVGDPTASAAASDNTGGGPARSADEIRNRLSSFQRGVREARAAAPKTEEP
jgi:hypothetical protein